MRSNKGAADRDAGSGAGREDGRARAVDGDHRADGDGSTDQRPSGDGSTDQRPSGDGSTDQRPGGDGSTDLRGALDRERERSARLQRITELIRAVNRAAVQAATRDELVADVCERLVDAGSYRFVWLGDLEPATSRVRPLASHGEGQGYLDAIEVALDDGDRRGPGRAAIETGEPQVVNDVATDPDFEPWREPALDRGFRAVAAVPVVYEETVYGLLAVYAGDPAAFDDRERAVLAELGETVGLAMGAIERRRALVADSVVEVDLAVADHPLNEACAAADAGVSLDGVAVESGDGYVFYLGVDGDPAALARAVEKYDRVERSRVVDGPDPLVEVVDRAPHLTEALSARGGTVTALTCDGSRTRVTAEFPPGTDVRAAVEGLPHQVTLLAQRTAEEPAVTRRRFEERVTDRLTDRQQAALRTAYLAGYHDRPRTSSGEAVAEALGVSPSTFHQHHRIGVRKLLSAAFGSPGEPE